MKTTLKISILLNVLLLGALIFLWANPRKEGVALPPDVTKAGPPTPVASISAAPIVRTEVEFRPFRWSQLLSKNDDYRAFVANLRAAGCPEPTVGDIVRGDAERAFYAKRAELNVDGTESGPWSAQAQIQLVANLLGQSAAKEMAADAAAPSPAARHRQPAPVQSVSMPIVMQKIDPAALGLNNDQQQLIAEVHQHFLEQVGGTNQNPKDPAFLARWQQAQIEADTRLQAMLGYPVYMKYQIAGYQMALENQERPARN
ncbi:MAG: hypothetical protein ABSC24_12590 [Verrucomicrobiota bacterium]